MKLNKIIVALMIFASSSAFAGGYLLDREEGQSCETTCENAFPMSDITDVQTLPHNQCQCWLNDGGDGGDE